MEKKILFRADGNSSIGLGHLYRLFAFVEMVRDTYEFLYVTKEDSEIGVIPKEYPVRRIPKELPTHAEPNWFLKNFRPSEHIIVTDGYHYTSSYQHRLKKMGYALVYIDDLAKEYMYADYVINHNPKVEISNYKKAPYTQLALGTDYASLRPLFLETAGHKRRIDAIHTVFVCFGGADYLDLSSKAGLALLQIPQIKKIHIVLGAGYKHRSISDIARKNEEIHLHRNLNEREMLDVMLQCHLAIAPSSTILYELCAVNMAVISGYFVDNQKSIYEGFLEKKAIFGIGDLNKCETEHFKTGTEAVLESKNYPSTLKNQQKMFDSQIKRRYLNIINRLC